MEIVDGTKCTVWGAGSSLPNFTCSLEQTPGGLRFFRENLDFGMWIIRPTTVIQSLFDLYNSPFATSLLLSLWSCDGPLQQLKIGFAYHRWGHLDNQPGPTPIFILSILYRRTWIWRTTVQRTFVYDGRDAWSQSHAYQVCVICIKRILHMTDQFSWSH